MKENMIDLALSYLFKGYSVIAVGPNKIPLFPWKEYQTRKPTPEEIVKWWTDNPDAQIGIVTGKISNLTVIDIEADGDFNLVPDETYTVQTGGGGRHYYFTYDDGFKNAVRVFPNVDQRSEGGYVIAAGSTSQKGPYVALNSLPPAQMSEKTRKSFMGANLNARKELPWFATSVQSAYPAESAEGLVYEGAGEGSRNDSMAKFAGTLHAKLHPSLWATVGWDLFEKANQKNTPPLPVYELANTWKSIGQKEMTQNPNGRDYSSALPKTWGPAPESEIKTEPNALSGDSKDTLHVAEIASLQVIDSEHTYPLDMPPIDDALLGGFSAGEVIVVAGQSGHGKTTLIQDWSVTLASGGKTQHDKLPTLWFSYEVLARPLWEKFKIMGANEETPIYMPRFNESGDIEWLTEVVELAIQKWGIKVICIDHLGFLRAPKGHYSNAADAVTHTVRALKRLAIKYGLIVMLPVHVRKTNSKTPDLNDIRDSLGIAQEADTVFFINREKDDFGLPTSDARVWLVKNRKSGIAVNALFEFQFGRYYYQPEKDKKSDGESDAIAALKSFDDWVK